jgi:hypothetical protein
MAGSEVVDADTARRPGRRRGIDDWGVALLLGAATLLIGIPVVINTPAWSPIDEQTHVDYAWELSHGRIPHAGEPIADEILEEWACAGQTGATLPACGSELDPDAFPGNGENYNYWQPPTYYLFAGLTARLLTALFNGLTFDMALRAFGLFVTALGAILLYKELRAWNVARLASFSGTLLVVALPPIVSAATRATPDSAVILSAVVALYLVRRIFLEKKRGLVVPVVLTIFITSIKVVSALPLMSVALIVLINALWGALSRHRARSIALAVSMFFSFFLVHFSWSGYQSLYTPSDWVNPVLGVNQQPLTGSPLIKWFSTAFSGTEIVGGYYFPDSINKFFYGLADDLLNPVVVGIIVLGWLLLRDEGARRPVAWALLVGALAWPMAVQIQVFLSDGTYFPLVSTRYGISLLGLVGAVLAMVAERWRVSWPLLVLAIVEFALMFCAGIGGFGIK